MTKHIRAVCRVRLARDADVPQMARVRSDAQAFDRRLAGLPLLPSTVPVEDGLRMYLKQGYPARYKLPAFVLELDGQIAGFALPMPYDGVGVDEHGFTFYTPPFTEGARHYGIELAPRARRRGVERRFQRAIADSLRDHPGAVAVDFINHAREFYDHVGMTYSQQD